MPDIQGFHFVRVPLRTQWYRLIDSEVSTAYRNEAVYELGISQIIKPNDIALILDCVMQKGCAHL